MHFSDFSFTPHLVQAIQACGFTAPTPIQEQAIPPILAGRDLLGLAQTGTGKTAAFVLPTIQHLLKSGGQGARVLILAPTRELAEQIHTFVQTVIDGTRLRSIAVYGGVSKQGQSNRIRRGVDIIVACPGRLLDLLNEKVLDLAGIETLILDEADHMFDQGFLPDIRRILRQVPDKRQTLVLSATMPDAIRSLAEDILKDPVTVQLNPTRSVRAIDHQLYTVEQTGKMGLLMHLLATQATATTLVFTRTKHRAKSLAGKLDKAGFKATSLQGNLSQNRRQQALDGFKDGTFTILVATDIAARGIDVHNIAHVINYDMPDTTEAYIHRTGRTGRASRSGEALNFVTAEDQRMVRMIEQTLAAPMKRLLSPKSADLPQVQEIADRESSHSGRPARAHRSAGKQQPRSGKPAKATAKATSGNRSGRPAKGSVFGLSSRGRH